jgi:hypothetical protein
METNRRPVLLSLEDPLIAAEKGRLWAARALANNPEQLKRLVDTYGEGPVKTRYPELFSKAPFFRRIIDKISFFGSKRPEL